MGFGVYFARSTIDISKDLFCSPSHPSTLKVIFDIDVAVPRVHASTFNSNNFHIHGSKLQAISAPTIPSEPKIRQDIVTACA
jgi:hypothetical protein